MEKLKHLRKQHGRKQLASFQNFNTTISTSECITASIVHHECLRADFEKKYNDLMTMDHPLWLVELLNYEPEDENAELVEMLLDLKENVKLRRRIDKEGVHADISTKDSHPNVPKHLEASSISFLATWMVESGFSAVVNVFSIKRNKLDPNSRGTIRLRLNNFLKINYDILYEKHQDPGNH